MNDFITAIHSSHSPPDYEHDSSSSSSGGDHSSPASDSSSAAPYPSQVATPFEDYSLGMGDGALAGITGGGGWNVQHVESMYGGKGAAEGMIGVEEGSLALTSDFWSTAPSTTVHSPEEQRSYAEGVGGGAGASTEMEVEFDDMVHRSSCGPSAISPASYTSPHASTYPMVPPSRPATYVSHDQSTLPPPTGALYISAFSTLSMPVNLMAVNAGISPQLTGGQPSPPLPDVKAEFYQIPIPVEQEEVEDISVAPSRSNSTSRKGAVVEEVEKASTNLVTKDAVVASSIITSILKPSRTTAGLDLLVLGVPAVGAKSRVETQIKISLVLVGPKKGKGKTEEGIEGMTMEDGGLVSNAGDGLTRIGSWSHVRLPSYLALKKKNKKAVKPDPPAEDTLLLDVSVVRGSSPHEEVFICTGCRQREHKRAQRKKEARVRPVNDANEDAIPNEEEERRKVVIFNCAEYVEFGAGETVLPTRITCYCRHHKERKGFSIHFALKTSTGFVVASGQTPPIMITDDHKTSVRPSAANSVAHSADASIDSASESLPVKRTGKGKKGKATPQATVARPKRATARASTSRGLAESDDEGPVSAATTKKHSAAKPYDSDARPRKRSSGVHRSPSFAMTPLLAMSKPASPILRPLSDDAVNASVELSMYDATQARTTHAEMQSWESALGLGGMGDAIMGDGTSSSSVGPNTAFSPRTAYSTAATSTAPSPAQSYDWRSSASTPPLSPRPTTAHSNPPDAYSTFFNGLQSPVASPPSLQRNLLSGLGQLYTSTTNGFGALANSTSTVNWHMPQAVAALPPPRISRLIPGEGPVHGGIEVTVLGENFVRDLVCVFGDSPAVPTHFWSSSTLVCILPPSANPGPVVVGIKGVPFRVDEGAGLQLFTYKDDSDRSLLELALQVVGLKMTGRLEDATAVAMRIVGNSTATSPTASSRHASPTDTAGLAMRMSAASASVYDSGTPSRPPSRQASFVDLARFTSSPLSTTVPLPATPLAGGRNFEGIVIKFLSLLDLDPSDIPGSAPSLPLAQSPISHVNAQSHSLLHLATLLGFHRLVQFLLSRGIAVDRADRNGYTALHFSALYGRVAITRLLLDAGAHHLAKNLAGQTPLDIALDRDDVDVQEVFHRLRPTVSSSTGTRTPTRPSFISLPGTPISEYATSEVSDFSTSASESSDDESFHTSDEETDEEDVERGLSRNASMVSLRSLVNAEYDIGPKKVELIVGGTDRKDSIDVVDLASASAKQEKEAISAAWLSETLKTIVPPSTPLDKDKAPSTGVWDKMPGLPYANGAWDKIRLPAGFNIPLQMPVAVFPSMASMPAFSKHWMGGHKSETEEDSSSSDETSSVRRVGMSVDGRKIWRDLYGPWWGGVKSSSPPPPSYSESETVQPLSPSALPPLSPTASTSRLTLSPMPSTSRLPPIPTSSASKHMQAKVQRRVGYAPEMSEGVVKSYLHHEKAREGLRQDKMLLFFWLPILLFALVCGVYSSLPQIRPVYLAAVDTILPWARDLLRS